jgi:hypothetical protein
MGYFSDRSSWTICPDWLWTAILLISASWVAKITGVSHQRPVGFYFLNLSSAMWIGLASGTLYSCPVAAMNTNLMTQNSTVSFSYTSRGWKSETSAIGLKSKWQQEGRMCFLVFLGF